MCFNMPYRKPHVSNSSTSLTAYQVYHPIDAHAKIIFPHVYHFNLLYSHILDPIFGVINAFMMSIFLYY